MSLSVCIITLNEEDNLPRCLASVRDLATQIVVVDSLSTDGTCRIAAESGAEVVQQEFLGHVRQKQFALERATGEWVLCLDADEWLDERLQRAVADVLAVAGGRDGYALNRRTEYLGRWIDHCGWSPEWHVRLVRRGRAHWTGIDPHDRLEPDGPVGRLPGRLNHRPYHSLAAHMGKVNAYTDIMVRELWASGRRGSIARLVLRPPARFLRMYVLKAGFLDGWRGLVVCGMGAVYVFAKYAKLLALERGGGAAPSGPSQRT